MSIVLVSKIPSFLDLVGLLAYPPLLVSVISPPILTMPPFGIPFTKSIQNMQELQEEAKQDKRCLLGDSNYPPLHVFGAIVRIPSVDRTRNVRAGPRGPTAR